MAISKAKLSAHLSITVLTLLAASLIVAAPAAAQPIAQPRAFTAANHSAVALPLVCDETSDPNTVQVMIDIDSAFAYAAPDWKAPTVGRLVKFQCFIPSGRNQGGEWLLVPYGNSQAWINYSMVRVKGEVTSLPVKEDVVIRTTLTGGIPKGLPVISWRMRQLYLRSARAGLDPTMFTVMGDCNSEPPVYLGRFAAGGADVSNYPTLRATVARFSRSFSRASLATHGSFNVGMALDPTWANPEVCKADEGPLACELRVSRASILIVSLGTGDQHTWQNFEQNYRAVIDYTLKAGVVPVLMTKADALESLEGGAAEGYINDVIRRLGREFGVPVIDFWMASRNLPNNGLAEELTNDMQTANPFHLSEPGMDTRMLMTLFTLKSIWGR
jgi:hypothetical protein